MVGRAAGLASVRVDESLSLGGFENERSESGRIRDGLDGIVDYAVRALYEALLPPGRADSPPSLGALWVCMQCRSTRS